MRITIKDMGKKQDDYLSALKEPIWTTEKNIFNILNSHPDIKYIKTRKKFSTYRYIPDYQFVAFGNFFIVEFQGFRHYTDPVTIHNDMLKFSVYRSKGFHIIEVPYFLQLNSDMFYRLFKFEHPSIPDTGFPHGFIHPKAGFPGMFCNKGHERYMEIMGSLPSEIFADVILSVIKRSELLNISVDYCL